MTVYAIIHTTVDDTETHHRQMVPKIMETVERHGGRRIALVHGEQLRVHEGEPPNANRVVIHEFPDHESVKHWVEEIRTRRDELHTLGESQRGQRARVFETNWGWRCMSDSTAL
jgi:uncharacterized protein (DUF1330 family)